MASTNYETGYSGTRYSGAMGYDRGYAQDDEAYGDRHYGNRDSEREVAIDETGSLIASNKVEGTAVFDRDGDRMGSIYNFMVNKRSGRVEYAVLTFGGFLGMGGTYYPLPWDMLTYNTRLGGYMVDMDEDDLDEAPSYRGGQEPDYDDDRYGRYVYGYYGLPY